MPRGWMPSSPEEATRATGWGIDYPTVLANDLNKLLKVENSTKPLSVSAGNKSDKEESDRESNGLAEADSGQDGSEQ